MTNMPFALLYLQLAECLPRGGFFHGLAQVFTARINNRQIGSQLLYLTLAEVPGLALTARLSYSINIVHTWLLTRYSMRR